MMRIWLAMLAGAGFLVASGVIASMARAQPGADPSVVITGFEMARNRHDLDAALTYFADNAVITQRNTAYTGKEEIRKYLDTFTTRSRYVVVSDRHSSGNLVTWTERTTVQSPDPSGRPTGQVNVGQPGLPGRGGNSAVTGNTGLNGQSGFAVSVEAVVLDGKIQSMAYAFGSQVTRPDPALEGRAQLPASIGLAAVLAVMAGIVLIASTGFGRATPGVSTLRGRLMQDLQGWAAARQ
jgi:hypothetical protein